MCRWPWWWHPGVGNRCGDAVSGFGVMGGRDSDDRGGGMMALEKIDDDVGGYLV